jgi:hypothetical protein
MRILSYMLTWTGSIAAWAQSDVSFIDPNLEAAVRAILNKPIGQLTRSNLEELTFPDFSSLSITNLAGLEYATNISGLYLTDNRITDIGALANLQQLTFLDISENEISDISRISGLTNISDLFIYNNSIRTLAPVSGLNQLYTLHANNNQIQDAGPLLQLASLRDLTLGGNPLTNCAIISALTNLETLDVSGRKFFLWNLDFIAGLTNLSSIYVTSSALTNINVLLTLPRLIDVDLERNLLDLRADSEAMNVITTLQTRAFSRVYYLPQWSPANVQVRSYWPIAANETSLIPLSILDDSTDAPQMIVVPHSSNQVLLPDSGLSLQRWFLGWTLSATPSSNATGTVAVSLTATDLVGLNTNVSISVKIDSGQPISSPALSSNLVWKTSSNSPFSNQVTESVNGVLAVQNGSDQSWLETTVNGPGTLTFWWKGVSTNFFAAEFSAVENADAFCTRRLVGYGGWDFVRVGLPSGLFHLKWNSYPDTQGATYWVDEVNFTPGTPTLSLSISYIASDDVRIVLNGELNKTYDLETSTDLNNWTSLARIFLYDSLLVFRHESPLVAQRFYRLHQID